MQSLIVFDSTHHALRGEQVLQQAGIPANTIPTPREISASCGLALQLAGEHTEQAIQRLEQASVLFSAVYELTVDNGVKRYRLRGEE